MNHTFFARADDAQVGSFHYPLGMVAFTTSAAAHEIIRKIVRMENPIAIDENDENKLMQLAYEMVSYLHEMRHFVDTFGTMAGISLFSARLAMLKEFMNLSEALRSGGMRWRFPDAEWSGEIIPSQDIRDYVRRARAFDVGSDIYIAPFSPVEIDGHLDEGLIELEYERGGTADAFPLRVGLLGEDGTERLRTVLFPLGVEALMEGNAHAFCRSFIEHHFPESVAQRLQYGVSKIKARDEHGRDDQRAAQTTTPYMVTDLLITRFLRNHGISKFPRDLVFALTDRILAMSAIRFLDAPSGKTALHVDRVGAKLVGLLEAADPQSLGSGIIVADVPDVTEAYKGVLAGLEQGGDWHTVDDDNTPRSSIAIWESYIAQNIIVPLLRARLASNHEAFASYEGFVTLLSKVGSPPARVANGQLTLSTMPPRVQQAWLHQMMLGEILHQLVRGNGSVFCPRAYGTVPGLNTMNLAFEGDCQRHRRLGCGTFRLGQAAVIAPKCLFEDGLRVSALQR